MAVRANSAQAREDLKRLLSERARMILAWFEVHGRATDRECMAGLGFREPNQVRPRITELIAGEWLEEVADVKCPVTGVRVRIVDVKGPPPVLPLFATMERSPDA